MHKQDQRLLLNEWNDLSRSCFWWEPYKEIVIATELPSIEKFDERGFLHCDGGPALLCRDGWPLWMLHGVRMSETQVMTPAEKLDPADCLKEQNTEVRRELIRKIGVERMLAKLPHKTLDKRDNYEVLSIDFPGLVQDARYLKMLNPSIGVWHLEGIERECDTVQKAINWRAGTFGNINWNPAIIT
jgi:hypothetical protein